MSTPFGKRRFITDESIIREILDRCKIIHIGMRDGDSTYVLPSNYAYRYENGVLTLYTHGAAVGHKWDLLAKNANVGFEIDTGFQLVDGGDVACNYSNAYASIIGKGVITPVTDNKEKCRIMTLMMKQQADRDFEFKEAMVSSLGIMRLDVSEFTCKSGYLYEQPK